MSSKKLVLEDLEKTITRLEEAVKLKKTDIVRDSAIKRFELCFDLAWKNIQIYARKEGMDCYSPRGCIKTAFQLNLIEYDDRWLEMLEDRNLTVHMYKENIAEAVYGRLPSYIFLLKGLIQKLSQLNP